MSPAGKCMTSVSTKLMVKAAVLWTTLTDMEKSSKYMSLKIYNFSTMYNIQYKL